MDRLVFYETQVVFHDGSSPASAAVVHMLSWHRQPPSDPRHDARPCLLWSKKLPVLGIDSRSPVPTSFGVHFQSNSTCVESSPTAVSLGTPSNSRRAIGIVHAVPPAGPPFPFVQFAEVASPVGVKANAGQDSFLPKPRTACLVPYRAHPRLTTN